MPCCGYSVCFNCVEKTFNNIIYNETQIRLAGKHKCRYCNGVLSELLFNSDLTEFAKCYYVNYLQLAQPQRAATIPPEYDLAIFDPDYYVSKYAGKLPSATLELKKINVENTIGAFLAEYFSHLFSCVQQFTNHRVNLAHTGLDHTHAQDIVRAAERKSVPALLVARLFPKTLGDEVNGLCTINWKAIYAVFDKNFQSIDLYEFILLVGPRTTFFFKMRTDGLVSICIDRTTKFFTHYSALIVKGSDPDAKRLAAIKYAIAQDCDGDLESIMGGAESSNSNDTVYDVSSDSESESSDEGDGEYYDKKVGTNGIRKLSDHSALLYSMNIRGEMNVRGILNIIYEPETNLTLALDFKCQSTVAAEVGKFSSILKNFF